MYTENKYTCKYTFFNILKTGQAKKLCHDFLRFVNILFLIFEKEDNQRNVHGCFKIWNYTLFIIWKSKQAKKLC